MMHHIRALVPLLLASQLASSLSIEHKSSLQTRAENREADALDEVVYLAECTEYADAKKKDSRGVQSLLLYHTSFDETRDSDSLEWGDVTEPSFPKSQRVDAMGTQVDWTLGKEDDKIEGKFESLDRTFSVHGLATKGDSGTNATGVADLGEMDMRCYSDPTYMEVERRGSYFVCNAPYFCTRARRQIRRTVFDISKNVIDVEFLASDEMPKGQRDPRVEGLIETVYYWLRFAGTDKVDGATEFAIDKYWKEMNTQVHHTIRFDIQAGAREGDPKYDPTRVVEISKHLVSTLTPEILKTVKNDGTFYSWKQMLVFKATFPAHIQVQVQIAFQEQLDWKATDVIDINIIANKYPGCGEEAAFAKLLSGLFSAAGAVLSGGASAVMTGLGGLTGAMHTTSCLSS